MRRIAKIKGKEARQWEYQEEEEEEDKEKEEEEEEEEERQEGGERVCLAEVMTNGGM